MPRIIQTVGLPFGLTLMTSFLAATAKIKNVVENKATLCTLKNHFVYDILILKVLVKQKCWLNKQAFGIGNKKRFERLHNNTL